MFPRLRALNEEDSNSDSDEDGNKRPSKEAQEEQAVAQYNQTLLMMARSETKEAIASMENLLMCPYLNEEVKTSSPIQNQIRLGCLKNLSTAYCHGPFKNLDSAIRVLLIATQMDPKNVNLWIKLGNASKATLDYYLSHIAFVEALKCSPNHWECIEQLVTLSYVLNDPKGCLHFCALGLEKDVGFLKGLVFRDHVFKIHPFLKEFAKSSLSNFDHLMTDTAYDEVWKNKFLSEASELIKLQSENLQAIKSEEDERCLALLVPSIHFKTYSLVELCSIVMDIHCTCKREGIFSRPVCLKTTSDEVELSAPSDCKEDTSETTQDTTNAVRRSLSSNDEKEIILSEGTQDGTNEVSINTENEEYLNNSQSQMDQSDNDGNTKKKSRKDVKWWQLEGKRRSQRVRGNLLPLVANKPKSENGFAELLRNILPPLLLVEEDGLKDSERRKSAEGKTNPGENQNYFGSEAEINDVKNIIEELGTTDIITIIIYLTKYLATNCRRRWPQQLASEYLKLYTVYMSHTQRPDINSINEDSLDHLESYSFIVLAMLELCTEEITMNGLELLNAEESLSAELNYLYNILSSKVLENKEIMLRLKWLQVKHSLALCHEGHRSTCKYEDVLIYLMKLKEYISEDPEYQIIIQTRTDNLISLHEVEKKLNTVNRMQNLNKINELYTSQNYTEVIEILKFCLSSEESSSVCDAKNRYYLADSYHQIGDLECVSHCTKSVQICLDTRNEKTLDDCINLLEKICRDMKNVLSSRELRLIANSVFQILVFNDKQPNNNYDFIVTTAWCILHSILYHMESEEPVLYLCEESVPMSILVLQMAHEVLSRSGKCTINNGKLLVHTIDVMILGTSKGSEYYWMFEETKHVIEQAIFCLYSHPSKKSKLRYLSDHSTTGINLSIEICSKLYEYYKPRELPEFDSYDSISSEVEILFKRILAVIPEELKPTNQLQLVKQYLDESIDVLNVPTDADITFPKEYQDIFYLIADRNFKGKEWTQAIANYAWDITINQNRFDTWAPLALAKGEMINTRLNTADDVTLEELVFHSSNVLKCFLKSLDLEPSNMKIRIEFGSFAYAMHSYCSRFLKNKGSSLTFERFLWIEDIKKRFLNYTLRCFDPELKEFSTASKPVRASGYSDNQHDEVWMQHYMMGKVMEKGNPIDPSSFLIHYSLAGELLHKQGAPYPAKINFYNPPELAIETLEIYYRIHASILRFIEKHPYNEDKEKALMYFINLASESPFMKFKQSRSSEGGESKKRKQSVTDEAANKKEIAEVMNTLLTQVETLVTQQTEGNATMIANSTNATVQNSDEDSISKSTEIKVTTMEQDAVAGDSQALKPADGTNKDGDDVFFKNSTTPFSAKQDEPPKIDTPAAESESHGDFPHTEWRRVIPKCIKAMQECIARFSQHHKAHYRLAKALKYFGKDSKAAKEVFIGSTTQKKKLYGLFSDRKANNLFNGIWRNPIEDIDRPGSFPFHMSKSTQLLIEILAELNDHQLLAEIGIQLSKVPDADKKYLVTEDREKYSKKAFDSCVEATKRFLCSSSLDITDTVLQIYDTFIKLNKLNQKENVITEVLMEAYRHYYKHFNQDPGNFTADQVLKFCQNLAWTSKTVPSMGKSFIMGRPLPQSIDYNQPFESIKPGEPSQVVVSQKKKLSHRKRLISKSSVPGGIDSKHQSCVPKMSSSGVDWHKKKHKNIIRPITDPLSLTPPKNTEKQIVCLDLTQDESPTKGTSDINKQTKSDRKVVGSVGSMLQGVQGSSSSDILKLGNAKGTDKESFYYPVSTASVTDNFYTSPHFKNSMSPEILTTSSSLLSSHQPKYIHPHETSSKVIVSSPDIPSLSLPAKSSTGLTQTKGMEAISSRSANSVSRMFSNDYPITTTSSSTVRTVSEQVAKKSTGLGGMPSRSQSPKMNHATKVPYSSTLNTSPYKQQSKAVLTPKLNYDTFGSDLKIVRSDRPMSSNIKAPPAAHCHTVRRYSTNSSVGPEPEIIDLTVKSPTKSESSFSQNNCTALVPMKRNFETSSMLSKGFSDPAPPLRSYNSPAICASTSSNPSNDKFKTSASFKNKKYLKRRDSEASISTSSKSSSGSSKLLAIEHETVPKLYPLPPKKKKIVMPTSDIVSPDITIRDNSQVGVFNTETNEFEVITLD